MNRVSLTATWAVCLLAAVGTAWLGSASGLFWLDTVGPVWLVVALAPYLVLGALAWYCRRRPAWSGLVLILAALAGGYGLFFYFNDWYWPQPTQPNPWRPLVIPVVVVPQGAAVGLVVVVLGALAAMGRSSILGLMLLVLLFALLLALLTGLGGEAICYVTGPLLGASLAALLVPRDRSALVTGGLIGGLSQGIVAVLLLRRGYPFGDVALLTGPLYLAALGIHLLSGLAFGLLFLALRRSRPRSGPGAAP